MPPVRTRGLVIGERAFEDRDKILTVLTEHDGKLSCIAKGVRSPKSPLAASCRLFSWSEFVYYPGKSFANITQASLIDPFYELGNDLYTMTLASWPLELINRFYDYYQQDERILKLAVYYLYYLAHGKAVSNELLTCVFALKLLQAAGICPDFSESAEPLYFSINDAALQTGKPAQGYAYKVSPSQREFLILGLTKPLQQCTQLQADKKDMNHLLDLLNHFIQEQQGVRFKTYELLKELRV